jgi:hypothetical protein
MPLKRASIDEIIMIMIMIQSISRVWELGVMIHAVLVLVPVPVIAMEAGIGGTGR